MTNSEKRDVIEKMREYGWLDFGAVTPAQRIRAMFGIKYPEVASKEEFDKLALEELGCVDFVRNQLLNEGKYLKHENGHYRVLLPSENEEQVRRYMENADSKLKRGIKLARNTPSNVYQNRHADTIRMEMKRQSTAVA